MRRQEWEPKKKKKKASGQILIPALRFSSFKACAVLVLKANTLCKSDVESNATVVHFQTDVTFTLRVYNYYLSLVSLHTDWKASAWPTHAFPLLNSLTNYFWFCSAWFACKIESLTHCNGFHPTCSINIWFTSSKYHNEDVLNPSIVLASVNWSSQVVNFAAYSVCKHEL